MNSLIPMDSQDLAKYIEAADGISKPWLLAQLRLKKLAERRSTLSSEQYEAELAELHQAVMGMGKWWVGIEDEEFEPGS
jgi:hypothetical protein